MTTFTLQRLLKWAMAIVMAVMATTLLLCSTAPYAHAQSSTDRPAQTATAALAPDTAAAPAVAATASAATTDTDESDDDNDSDHDDSHGSHRHWHHGGHSLTQEEVQAAQAWLAV